MFCNKETRDKKKRRVFIPSHPSRRLEFQKWRKRNTSVPVLSGLAEKRRTERGREEGEEEEEECRDRRPEGGLIKGPLFLQAEKERKGGSGQQMKKGED